MGFRNNNKATITKQMDSKIIDFLQVAGSVTDGEIKRYPNCPVITGNLKNSNFAEPVDEENLKVTVRNTAEYAIIVENRRHFFTTGLKTAEEIIKKLMKKIKL